MINVPSEDHNDAAMIGSSSDSNNFTDARTKHLLNNIKVARTTRGCHKELNPPSLLEAPYTAWTIS